MCVVAPVVLGEQYLVVSTSSAELQFFSGSRCSGSTSQSVLLAYSLVLIGK